LFRLPPGYGYQYDGYQGYQNQDQGLGGYMDQQGRQQQGEYRSGNQVLDSAVLYLEVHGGNPGIGLYCTVLY
jgi:crotonobetainyl-CoA:carnitine CoA-transferase CaiB-like acyl-CoA transferase